MMNARHASDLARRCSLPLAVLLIVAMLGAPARAQSSRTPAAASGPRALAVLELAPDGRARLVPIAIRIDNKFYDAGLFRAMPRPLAVDPQTVYEVQRSGAPLGLFTVTQAQTIKDVWVGLGQWRPMVAPAVTKKPVAPARQSVSGPVEVDDRPVLRRPGGASSSSAQSEPATPESKSSESKPPESPADPSRPTLKRPSDRDSAPAAADDRPTMRRPPDSRSTPAASDSNSTPATSDSGSAPSPDDDRPTLKRPQHQTASAPPPDNADRPAIKRSAAAEARQVSTASDDPARPTLRRGKPVGRQGQDEAPPLVADSPGAAHLNPASQMTANGVKIELLPAISDANVKESASLLMTMNPTERQLLEGKVRAAAYAAIQKWVVTHPQTRAATADQMHVTAFSVFNYNNDPVAVFTADLGAAPAPPVKRTAAAAAPTTPQPPADPGFHFFVTVVTRTNMYGELHTLLAQVTDTRHLDAYRRLDLIDAVDFEGYGTGQLLFRRVSDRGFSYGIYRVSMDRCVPIFESAEKDL